MEVEQTLPAPATTGRAQRKWRADFSASENADCEREGRGGGRATSASIRSPHLSPLDTSLLLQTDFRKHRRHHSYYLRQVVRLSTPHSSSSEFHLARLDARM
jgi:hypothetical protein